MTLTYADIARWIEPVAEKPRVRHHYPRLTVGMAELWKPNDEWVPPGGHDSEEAVPLAVADLACMELVRRLNAKGWAVHYEHFLIVFHHATKPNGSRAYTTHPLEAVARFAREVGA